jgi:hypothetical protein
MESGRKPALQREHGLSLTADETAPDSDTDLITVKTLRIDLGSAAVTTR